MHVNLEQLLQHREFLTSLARGLVQDPMEQEELLWETMGEGALRPPDHTALKPWLARVLIHRALARHRAKRRRLLHEQAGSKPDRVESAAEVAARLELVQELATHVQSLDTDFRDVVLFRFFENLPPREIAKRLDLPVETVKQRLRRALALLRTRLDKDHGSREKWLGSLILLTLPSAKASSAGLKTIGLKTLGASMTTAKTKTALAATALLLILGAGILYVVTGLGLSGDDGPVALGDVPVMEAPTTGDLTGEAGAGPAVAALPLVENAGREPLAPMAEGEIQGRVVDQLSDPVAGVELLLYRGWDWEPGAQTRIVSRIRSDRNGEFHMRGLELGLYTLRAIGEGYASTAIRVLADEFDPMRLGLTLQLMDGYPLRGVIVDVADAPVAGAYVLACAAGPVGYPATWSEVRSDAKGRFTFESLAKGKLQVLAWAEGYSLGLLEGDPGATESMRIVLPTEGPLGMTFRLAEPGQDIDEMPGDVTVEARYYIGNATVLLPSPIRALSVPSEGQARFRGLREGQYLFLPRSHQVALEKKAVRQALRRERPEGEIELAWSARLGLDVKLVDSHRKPVRGLVVSTPSAIDRERGVVRSDEEGRFSFEGLFRPGSEVVLAMETPGYRFLPGRIPSSWMRYAAGGAEHVLTVVTCPVITGRVVNEREEPVAGAKVWLRSPGSPGSHGRTRTDVHGDFRISRTSSRETPLVLDAHWGTTYCERPLLWESLDPESGKKVIMRLVEGASIEGSLVDEEGNGIPGGWVFATLMVRRQASLDVLRKEQRLALRALSDRNGRFRITGLEPGTWQVTASMEAGISMGKVPFVKIQRGQRKTGLRLVLTKGLSISGRLVDDRGTALAGTNISATLECESPRTKPGGTSWGVTDADGHYTLKGLLAGSFRLRAQLSMEQQRELGLFLPGPGGGAAMRPRQEYVTSVRAGTKGYRWQIRTPRFGDVRMQLAFGGEPLSRIRVVLSSGEHPWSFVLPIDKGVLSMKRVLAGTYKLTLESPRYADLTVPIQVRDDRLTDLGTLTLARLEEVEGRVVDEDGKPLSGVWIGVDKWLPRMWHLYGIGDDSVKGMVLTKTDARGGFRIPAKANLTVFGFKPGYAPASCALSARKLPGEESKATPQQDMMLVLNRSGEVLIQAPNLPKGQRSFWRYKFGRLPIPERTASKKKRSVWLPGIGLDPGKPVRHIGLEPGRYRLEVANFERVRSFSKTTVPGESYFEEFQIKPGTKRIIKIP